MFRSKKLVGNRRYVGDYKAYQYYRDREKHRNKKNVKDFVDHGRILGSIYKKIGESISEYEGGVFIKGMMYLIPQLYPEKVIATIPSSEGFDYSMNTHTQGRFATILFVNLFPGNKHEFWTMDNAFFKSIKTMVSTKLKEFKPTFTFSLKSLLKASR